VLDALAEANRLRPVFEPLHPRVSCIGSAYANRALGAEDGDHLALREFLEEVCAGRRERMWTKYRCQPNFLVPTAAELLSIAGLKSVGFRWRKFVKDARELARASSRREPLVKCIWANLMLGWLARHCGFRTVLVVRHPAAVVESKLRNAWTAKPVLDRFRRDRTLQELTKGRYKRLLAQRITPVQELTLQWLIENQWVIEDSPKQGTTVVFYERLRSLAVDEWRRILSALNLKSIPGDDLLGRPSQQTAPYESAIDAGTKDLQRWQRVLTRDERAQIASVLVEAGFHLYSIEAAEPDPTTVTD
jgi:hypothetical protein